MHIVFRDYIARLEQSERAKPPGERRYVPTMGEVAEAIGVNPVTLSKLMSGKIHALNLETGGKIIRTMRQYGFEMVESDLVRFVTEETPAN